MHIEKGWLDGWMGRWMEQWMDGAMDTAEAEAQRPLNNPDLPLLAFGMAGRLQIGCRPVGSAVDKDI